MDNLNGTHISNITSSSKFFVWVLTLAEIKDSLLFWKIMPVEILCHKLLPMSVPLVIFRIYVIYLRFSRFFEELFSHDFFFLRW